MRQALGTFVRLVVDMDRTLSQTQWLVGDGYTLADVALTPYANRLEMLGLAELWDRYPNFSRWFEAAKARSSFMPALFAYLPAELRESMTAHGLRALPRVRQLILELQ